MKKFIEKIYNGLPSQKESCKKSFSCALRAKSIKLGKKCISVYLITKINGNHFLASSMKQIILKRKMKNHFREISLVLRFDALSYRELAIFSKKLLLSKVVSQRCSVKKMFSEISQNSQEYTCARVSFLIKLQA